MIFFSFLPYLAPSGAVIWDFNSLQTFSCNVFKLGIYILVDVDECEEGNDCHPNALCTNTEGSYVCRCFRDYEGDGRNCTGMHNRRKKISPPTV